MSHLKVSPQYDAETGQLIKITPQSAGWKYVGFEVVQLRQGQSTVQETLDNEVAVVVLSGIVTLKTKAATWNNIGQRMSVFEKIAPYTVYVPAQDRIEIAAETEAELAFCKAPGGGGLPARLIAPTDVGVEVRGKGNMERLIHNILPESQPADSLLVVEVFTPQGHWSSYPPHKHDQLNLPEESLLEETYYHKISPDKGFAIQRVYTDDRSLDETIVVGHNDVVLVPKGYHPVGAPPGYEVYYLNVMAGPVRSWKFKNDKDHAWLFGR
ncbi:5-deoxy-glucuronate isomerase [Paenibacillus montaniterrae]|uniref:5-deoxy-glucuronate isomerase n=1 Tax=Paenibacillus montaniterrae TaxID=429341 RepID=A0A920CYV5_9BACL|nr:5-deoxy-glucuronate isomerase [Paenibacillus montaniterrae]GIP16404.1 5-deoxy-glucuronate isomerase [Paenibacillus montaniterrae]